MSKNKKYRNFSPNTNGEINADSIEFMDSSENELDEVSELDNEVEIDETPTEEVVESPSDIVLVVEELEDDANNQIDNDTTSEGNIIPKDEPIVSGVINTIPERTEYGYTVAVDLSVDSTYEKISTNDYDDACNTADEQTKNTGIVHHVYNTYDEIVYSAKKKLTLLYKKRGNKNVNWYS